MKTPDPNAEIVKRLEQRLQGPCCFSLVWDHEQYYLPGSPTITLGAVCLLDDDEFRCVITDEPDRLKALESELTDDDAHRRWQFLTKRLDARELALHEPLPLETVRVPKPWGREIWYTGIEERGVCTIGGTPLPWLLSMAPELLAGLSGPPVLLKILDPLAHEIYGDLYFELHEEKTEVYVVTHIDENAWPDGIGRIRFGFDADKVNEFDTEEAFKAAYLDAVKDYREVRTKIDDVLDEFREAEGFSPTDTLPVDRLEAWQQRIDPDLNEQEQRCRHRMNEFTALRPLEVGDVVHVPPFVPHSLQHGVRVVEFQTPHYERYILSFAQKVLTQSGWDTEAAMQRATLDAGPPAETKTLSEEPGGHRVDLIADFDQFQVQRIALDPGVSWTLPSTGTYQIVMSITGQCELGGQSLRPEQACYLTARGNVRQLSNAGKEPALALLAIPKR